MQSMKAGPKSRHRPIVEAIEADGGTLIREDYFQHPQGISNVYMLAANETVRWNAELPSHDDIFTGPFKVNGTSFRCATWKGLSCEISLDSGRIVESSFTK
jgi:hypothetical protein